MRNRVTFFLIIFFFISIFMIFYFSINSSNLYTPITKNKVIPKFSVKSFYEKKTVLSENIFKDGKFYVLNIWASWCLPCIDEHSFLLDLSRNKQIEIIGLNYKDSYENAEKFIKELGNPYSKIFLDRDGTTAIELGAFGVPETFLIYNNQIIKKYIGPLKREHINEIRKIIK